MQFRVRLCGFGLEFDRGLCKRMSELRREAKHEEHRFRKPASGARRTSRQFVGQRRHSSSPRGLT